MKTLLRKWRGLQIAAALAAAVLPLHGAEVKTLGGGPNNSGFSRYGSANGNTLLNAKFFNPYGVAQDQNGNLFIADRGNNKVRKITNPGAVDSFTTTFKSSLLSPVGVAVDGSNNVYVVTQGDGKVRKYSNSGRLLRTIGRLSSPTAVAVGTNFTIYVVELGGSLWQIPMDGPKELLGPGGFNQPRGIAVMKDGRLAITTSRDHAVYTVDPNNPLLSPDNDFRTLLAGGNGSGFNDGPGGLAQFNGPFGIATAPNGSLVVADRYNNRVRLVTPSGTVSTLFGVAANQWAASYPGWSDGDAATAASRAPVGVAVGNNGTVYDTEVFWHIIRQATGLGLGATAGGSGATTNVVGTNIFVGTNIISWGFASGEASSDFVGAAGQSFYAPVTLSVAPGQKVYSFQMALSATNETGVALDPLGSGFASKVSAAGQVIFTNQQTGELVTNNTGTYYPILPNSGFLNSSLNVLGIGWLARYQDTNLYNTMAQDLITYSGARDRLFLSSEGQVVLGAYRMQIPTIATESDSFRIAIQNASGVQNGLMTPVPLRIPTDGSLGAGAMNSVKRVTIASRLYIVGDATPFRWFNAGDFGNQTLNNSDVIELFQTAVLLGNDVPHDSDVFDAMDSSDGSGTDFGDDVTINNITTGNGILSVDDVYVTFRRSLDPSLKWFARYWSNGVRQVVEVPNTLGVAFDVAPKAKARAVADVPPVRPSVALSINDAMATPNASIQFPVHAELTGGYPLRVMMLSLTVEALDGSPAITVPVQFQKSPGFLLPDVNGSQGPGSYAAAWLDNEVSGLPGSGTLALLNVTIPATAGSGSAYRIHFNHFSASPNGTALFATHTSKALILLSDRSASTWGDGIADAWRLRFFGSIFSSDGAAGGDPDGDGVINSIEAANGTDPTDPLSN